MQRMYVVMGLLIASALIAMSALAADKPAAAQRATLSSSPAR